MWTEFNIREKVDADNYKPLLHFISRWNESRICYLFAAAPISWYFNRDFYYIHIPVSSIRCGIPLVLSAAIYRHKEWKAHIVFLNNRVSCGSQLFIIIYVYRKFWCILLMPALCCNELLNDAVYLEIIMHLYRRCWKRLHIN